MRISARTFAYILVIGLGLLAPSAVAAQPYLYANNAGQCLAGHTPFYLYQIDTVTGNVVTYTIPGPCDGRGIAKVGNRLYYTVLNSYFINCFDISSLSSCPALGPINGASAGLASIAYDGTNLWIQDYPYPVTKTVFKYNLKQNKVIGTTTMSNCDGNGCDGLEFVQNPGFFGGQPVFIANRSDHTGPYDVMDMNGKLVTGGSSFINPSGNPTGIAWDGIYFYTADIATNKISKWDSAGKPAGSITLSGYDPTEPPVIEDLTSEVAHPSCQPPPNTTMVAWYPFDEQAGTQSANLASGNTGNQINGPLGVPGGQVGGAAQFDGADQYIDSPITMSTNFGPASCSMSGSYSACPADFSIDVWALFPPFFQSFQTPNMVILDHRVQNTFVYGGLVGYSFFLISDPNAPNKIDMGLQLDQLGFDPSGSSYYSPPLPLLLCPFCTPTWHHLAATVHRTSSQGITWYFDGQCMTGGGSSCVTSDPTNRTGSLVNTSPLRIGAPNDNVTYDPLGFFNGALDELEIHNRVLTPQEILQIYTWGAEGNGKCRP